MVGGNIINIGGHVVFQCEQGRSIKARRGLFYELGRFVLD